MKKSPYAIKNILVAKHDYLDLIKKGEIYEIVKEETIFDEKLFYLSHNGKKINGWGFKSFELDINFT